MSRLGGYGCSADQIDTGYWVDWSRALLEASSLLFSQGPVVLQPYPSPSSSGSALWRIMCHVVYQLRASPVFQDGLHHQYQAISRNSSLYSEVLSTF